MEKPDLGAAPPMAEGSVSVDELLQLERLISRLSANFINLPSDRIDAEIEGGLRQIVEALEIDRSSLTQVARGRDVVRTTHSWAASGFMRVPASNTVALPWLLTRLRRGKPIVFSRLDELPPEAGEERRTYERIALRSHVALPVMVAGELVAVLGLATMRHERRWPRILVNRMQLVAEIFASALERKRAGEEYLQLSSALAHAGRVAAMGQLASSFAHEINQPLGASLTNAQTALRLLKMPQPDLAEVRAALEDIAADNRRAGEIVSELRRFLRRQEPSLQQIEVREMLEAVARFVSVESRGKDVDVVIELAEGLPDVMGVRVQVQQVLVNLLLNAFDALAMIPAGRRRVTIAATRASAGRVAISVSDCGPGVPEALRSQLFDPFVTTKPEGLGVGLAIAKTIVNTHGGHLEYRDSAGGGAQFEFSLVSAE